MRDLAELQMKIHANAVEKGWWEKNRSWEEARILIVSEISEALEEFRKDRMGVWWEPYNHLPGLRKFCAPSEVPANAKPEGFPIEIADAAIRIMDYVQRSSGQVICAWDHTILPEAVPEQLDQVTFALYSPDRHGEQSEPFVQAARAWTVMLQVAQAHKFSLIECIKLKHAYNKTRPYRHGGKAA